MLLRMIKNKKREETNPEKIINNKKSGSEGIELLSINEAKEFMLEHSSAEEYEQEFGKVEEG